MLFSLASWSDFKVVVSTWASLCVCFGHPFNNWRQTCTDVFSAMTSLRSSTNRKWYWGWCEMGKMTQLTYRPVIRDVNRMKFVVEMHVENQLFGIVSWCRCGGRRWTLNWKIFIERFRQRTKASYAPGSFTKIESLLNTSSGSVGDTVASVMLTSFIWLPSSSAKWTAD